MNGSALVRVLGRVGVVCVALIVLSLIGVQYAHVIGRNLALAHQLRGVEHDVVTLQARRAHQQREIKRLSDPRGAIPEIHDRLHLVGDKEAIIYLKHGRPAQPARRPSSRRACDRPNPGIDRAQRRCCRVRRPERVDRRPSHRFPAPARDA